MILMGIVMWVFAPEMMRIVTSDANVVSLGTEILRIEAWAEPWFAASIVAYGIFVGAGKFFEYYFAKACYCPNVKVAEDLEYGLYCHMVVEQF